MGWSGRRWNDKKDNFLHPKHRHWMIVLGSYPRRRSKSREFCRSSQSNRLSSCICLLRNIFWANLIIFYQQPIIITHIICQKKLTSHSNPPPIRCSPTSIPTWVLRPSQNSRPSSRPITKSTTPKSNSFSREEYSKTNKLAIRQKLKIQSWC